MLAVFALLGSAAAVPHPATPRLAVFPFEAQGARLGMALADRLTHALEAPAVPPELALALVPPYIVQDGRFLSPLTLLGEAGTNSRHAARVLQGALGVEVVVTGGVRLTGEGLELTLHVARDSGARSFRFSAPESAPGRLVRGAQAALSVSTGFSRRAAPLTVDLSSGYGDFVEGLTLLSQGRSAEAAELLARAAQLEAAEPRWRAHSRALAEVLADPTRLGRPEPQDAPLLGAVVALNARPFDAARASRAFAAASETLPLARLWRALLAVQLGRAEEEVTALLRPFSGAWQRYPFGAVQAALYGVTQREGEGAGAEPSERPKSPAPFGVLAGLGTTEAPAALLGGVLFAQALGDPALETTLATRLSRTLPTLPYAFERLSQLAFGADDPLAAAQALRTATRLEPSGAQSDLYWTNLGWAYYLLGVLGESETASKRALSLNPEGTVAWYNLGLVQLVSGRLEAALTSYAEGTARDLGATNSVDQAALDDLEDALLHYPAVVGVHYALGTLYEAAGEDEAAAAQFGRFIGRAGASTAEADAAERDALVASARARRRALLAPPPPLELSPVGIGLGPEGLPLARYLPGETVFLEVELSTPGEQLPNRVALTLTLTDPGGATLALVERPERLELPPESVALQLTELSFVLPDDLPAGRYYLGVRARAARAAEAQTAETKGALEVGVGSPSLVRQLIGRGVVLRDLTSLQPLYTAEQVADEETAGVDGTADAADTRLVQRLTDELARAADAAESVPEVTQGRFAGGEGAAIFEASTPRDVRDFLAFLLASGEPLDAPFAELYAQWAAGGAPTPAP